ncbi:DUF86 domain-containing protein [Desulfobacteraceae bacterium SEEP-SAG9]|nr:DUF86 domain-containing protein [Desulfobacteraceae bacterium SEEP-SAG9]
MVDRTLILRKLANLDEYRKQLDEYAEISTEDYEENWKTQRIVDRTLQISIETCLDIAGHIISDEELRAPESYGDMFKILADSNILENSLFNSLAKMTKFRNVIVHQYEKVDPEIVIGILRKNLNDFALFKGAIVRYLKTQEDDK